MSKLSEVTGIPRKTMTLFFVVDCSGSMSGDKIGAVNAAIEEVVPELRDISESNADAELKVAVLRFATGCEWLTRNADGEPGPVSAEDFRWDYLNAGGLTRFGEACRELNDKLSRQKFMKETYGSYAPVIMLLSDGEPTDDYTHALAALWENSWFKAAMKFAIAIGNDANTDILKEFTGTTEGVIMVHDVATLKGLIQFVSITSSQIGSQSRGTGDRSKQELVQEELKRALGNPDTNDDGIVELQPGDTDIGVDPGEIPAAGGDDIDVW